MHQIQLSAQLYKKAQRRAAKAGFSTVDDYVADVLKSDILDETPNLDHLFTPERRARLDRISAAVKAGGKTYRMEDFKKYLQSKRKAWRQKRAS